MACQALRPALRRRGSGLVKTFGREPVIVGDGGSLPVVNDFERIFGVPVLLLGFALPGENAHAPNEWLDLENFDWGLRTLAVLWDELAASPRP